jgi:hypothetical protein
MNKSLITCSCFVVAYRRLFIFRFLLSRVHFETLIIIKGRMIVLFCMHANRDFFNAKVTQTLLKIKAKVKENFDLFKVRITKRLSILRLHNDNVDVYTCHDRSTVRIVGFKRL